MDEGSKVRCISYYTADYQTYIMKPFTFLFIIISTVFLFIFSGKW